MSFLRFSSHLGKKGREQFSAEKKTENLWWESVPESLKNGGNPLSDRNRKPKRKNRLKKRTGIRNSGGFPNQAKEILKTARKQYFETIAATYEVMQNLLAGDPQTQWDRIVKEMLEGDSWASPDRKEHQGSPVKCNKAFLDCVELHKLTVFSPDAAERQRYYIQHGIRKPARASVRQFISRMQQLSVYLKYLPTLKNSPRAVATTKKGNVPFEAADLGSRVDHTGCSTTLVAEPVL
jgi:hypothetical protein